MPQMVEHLRPLDALCVTVSCVTHSVDVTALVPCGKEVLGLRGDVGRWRTGLGGQVQWGFARGGQACQSHL